MEKNFYIMNEKNFLIVDTDAGADDAMAILTLLGMELKNESPYQIKMITCVNGNTNVNNVVTNVLKTLDTAQRLDIPVYKGASRPLLNNNLTTEDYFGKDGFGDFPYPNAPNPKHYIKDENAAVALIKMVNENPGKVTILALGPLTNIALAIRLDENFFTNIKQLVIMGGSIKGGVDFNSRTDPEANRIVYSTRPTPKIIMIPKETCRSCEIPLVWRKDVLGQLGSKVMWLLNKSEAIALSRTISSTWSSSDTIAAVILARPDIIIDIDFELVEAEVAGEFGRGALFVYRNQNIKMEENVYIVENFDGDQFKEILLKYLNY